MNKYVVTNPATGASGPSFALATDAEVADAIGAADRAHTDFSRGTSVADRAAMMQRVADLHSERREGAFFSPSVLTDVSPQSDAYREEFFGPVAAIYRVENETAAVQVANDIPYGLGSYLFTTDAEQALRVADLIEAGMVFINGSLLDSPELPFGGVKRSGFGRELGRFGIAEFANKKLIRILK